MNDWMDMLRTKDDTVQLMMRLKRRGYRLYYLSNISCYGYDMLRQRRLFSPCLTAACSLRGASE